MAQIKFLTLDLVTGLHKLQVVIDDSAKSLNGTYSSDKIESLLSALKNDLTSNQGYFIVDSISSDDTVIANGSKVIVGNPASNGFVGHENSIAIKGADGVIIYVSSVEGLKAYNKADKKDYKFDSTNWIEDKQVSAHNELTGVQGGNATEQYHLTQTEHDTLVAINPTKLVHTENTETIGGDKTFTNNVIINGDLTTKGTHTSVNSTDLEVQDNMITINKEALTHDGVTLGTAGLEIDRGTAIEGNAKILFDEADDEFKVGLGTDLKPIGVLNDTDLTSVKSTLSAKTIVDTIDAKVSAGSSQNFIADGVITANNVVYLTVDGKAKVATSDTTIGADRVLGIAINSVIDGETVKVAKVGTVTGLTGLDVSKGLFLATNGGVTQTLPTVGFIHKIGIVKSATEFVIDIADYSILL